MTTELFPPLGSLPTAWPAPGDEQLGQLELLTSGAFAPFERVPDRRRPGRRRRQGRARRRHPLADAGHAHRPWRRPGRRGPAGLQDPEGSPPAVIEITERTAVDAPGDALRLACPVTALRDPEHGPFRALRRWPADVRAELGSVPVLALTTRRPLGQRQLGQLRHLADQLRARILLLPLVAGPAELVLRPESRFGPSAPPPASSPTAPSSSRCRCRRRAARPTSCGPAPLSPPPTGRPTCWQTADG